MRMSLWNDLVVGARRLRAERGFTLVALSTLSLGIGASVAIFTVVNAVMLRPLPYPDPERLVVVSPGQNANISLADAVAAGSPSLAATTGLSYWDVTLTGDGPATSLTAQVVDAGFFSVFGVVPALGRPFGPEARVPGQSDVMLLSHEVWQQRFGGDPGIIGRRLRIDGYGHQSRTVVGVMPRGFQPPFTPPERAIAVWLPFSLASGRTIATDSSWFVNRIVGRLRAGATVEGAAAEVRTTMERLRQDFGALIDADAARAAGAMGLLVSMVGAVDTPLLILLSAVGLVLLLACANLANLLLARGERRRQELAVRTALGATRSRLVREQLVEGLLLSVGGGGLGLGLGALILSGLRVSERSGLPRAAEMAMDGRVIAFALVVSLLCVVGFALLPAVQATRGDLRVSLGAGRRTVGGTRGGRRLGSALIAFEVALALVVVSGAGLLLSSLRALREVDAGLDPRQVLAVELAPPDGQYRGERSAAYYSQVVDRLVSLPGVSGVGAIHLLPFSNSNWAFPFLAEGHRPPSDGPLPSANFRVVTPGYFRTVGMPLVDGRDVQPSDQASSEQVGLINATLASTLWPGERAVGRTINLFGNRPFRIVGVVGDVRQHRLDDAARGEMYLPLPQFPVASMVVMVRSSLPLTTQRSAIEAAIAGINRDVPITAIRPLTDVIDSTMVQRRFFAGVLTFFGILALTLGAVGVYGVMSYAIGGRRHEFGVRMALGATGGQVVRGAMATGTLPLGVGLVVGLLGVVATSRLLGALLFEVTATDPRTLTVATLILLVVALAAVWIPSRRASRVAPSQALRAE